MREFSVPPAATVEDDENLTDMVWANAERFGDTVPFRRQVDGQWFDVTAGEFAAQVTAIAKGLIAAGLQPGDRVAIMSRTRYEWNLLDYGIWAAGCITVPIYESSSGYQAQHILQDSESSAVIVETPKHKEIIESIKDSLTNLQHVWQIESDSAPQSEPGVVAHLTASGAEVTDSDVDTRRHIAGADDPATIIYTSGTTGRPKGCVLTHRNFLEECRANLNAFPQILEPGRSMLMFLPMAHVLARAITLTTVYGRVTVGHTADVANLVDDLGTFRPNFIVGVPRVFEKVYNTAKQKAYASGRGKVFEAAERVSVDYSKGKDAGTLSLGLRIKHFLFSKLVFTKLHKAFGGRCIAAISGGGPLGERLTHFYKGMGLPVLEGYGLTETSAAVTVNVEEAYKVGTVGRPVAGVGIRIADDGEVLIKGGPVFRRYWRNQEATQEALEDGWLHTGDLGSLDDEGFLRITGRKKEIIVTAGGKNVSPAPLEDQVRRHPIISQCMVVGDKRPFVGALITLDEEFLPSWLEEHGRDTKTHPADLLDDPAIRAEVQAIIDEANQTVSKAEQIKQFRLLPADFSEASGEMTPSMKIRRAQVAKNHENEIEALYSA